jgi:DNA-binding transcriptional LysR family regulator
MDGRDAVPAANLFRSHYGMIRCGKSEAHDRHDIMHQMNLRTVDLNLLVVLSVVLRHTSTTRAATLLHMSQPAVSHALARGRALFGDRLLVRSGNQMTLTPRARDLVDGIEEILSDVSDLLERRPFDPAEATGRVAITATEGALLAVLGPALAEITTAAPGLAVLVSTDLSDSATALRSGGADIVLDVVEAALPKEFHVMELFSDDLVCVSSARPTLTRELGIDDYVRGKHVSVIGGTDAFVRNALGGQGVRRDIKLQLPGFVAAAGIVADSDLLLTIPRRLARRAAEFYPLRVTELPVDVAEVTLAMMWHGRLDTSPLHRWVRGRIATSAK